MWVQFQLGLHLLKVNCVICCFFDNKKFPFCKICFFIPVIGRRSITVWPQLNICKTLSVSKWCLVKWWRSSLSCRWKILHLYLESVFFSLQNPETIHNGMNSYFLIAQYLKATVEMLQCPYFVFKWLMVVGVSMRILYVSFMFTPTVLF